jgi:hypothetical protein
MGLPQKKYDDEELAMRERLMYDFPFYAENVLKIRPKEGGLIPFKLNKLQNELHQIIEKQKKETGKVRILIVKGRQGGCSTYVEARYFHKVTHQIGKKAFILTHLGEATANLYAMVNRYYENTPTQIRPSKSKSNTKELVFDKLDSGYRVSTAGAAGTGRSDTIHFFHGSEVAFWEKAYEHAAGVMQAAKAAEEVILESTANGMSGWFREQWVAAVNGKSDFIPVFFPWFVEDGYRKKLGPGFVLKPEEEEYKALYDLDDEQMNWKRSTEVELGIELFKQEYPANAEEAFQFSPVESFLDVKLILEAMNRPPRRQGENTAVIAGYDPSFKGKDRDAFIIRHGSHIFGLELPEFGEDHNARVRYLQDKLDNKVLDLDMIFIDAGGGGYNIKSNVEGLGARYSGRIRWVESGAAADNQNKAGLKRDEMFVDFKDLLTDKHDPLSITIDDKYKDVFLQDLTATGYTTDAKNRPKMESKESIKKRIKMSTDIADACNLLVASPISKRARTRRTERAENNFNYFEV